MPNILCLETSAKVTSVALIKDLDLFYNEILSENSHAQSIFNLIDTTLNQSKVKYSDLKSVAVSSGPGSYTGLRIATSVAKGICYASSIPLISVSTLLLVANQLKLEYPKADYYIPMIDARRLEVYYTIYNHQLETTMQVKNAVFGEEEIFPEFLNGKKVIVGGDGAEKSRNYHQFDINSAYAQAKFMSNLVIEKFENKDFENLAYFEPFYLKGANITQANK